MRILIVDDDLHGREGLRVLLRGAGHRVETAADGLQAIKKLKDGPLDLAIIDLNLPKLRGLSMSGWDLIRISRAFDPSVALIVVSAEHGEAVRAQAAALEVDHCLEKPIDPGRLETIVASLRPERAPAAARG